MTTIMSWTEQVIVIMATSEGKSLLFMLLCLLFNTRVTILVLLLMSLQEDLLCQVQEAGVNHLV
jgi:superfamily II DNA helicase RecQ